MRARSTLSTSSRSSSARSTSGVTWAEIEFVTHDVSIAATLGTLTDSSTSNADWEASLRKSSSPCCSAAACDLMYSTADVAESGAASSALSRAALAGSPRRKMVTSKVS